MNAFTYIILFFVLTIITVIIVKSLISIIIVQPNTVAIHTRHGKTLDSLQPGRYRFFGKGHTFETFDTRLQQFALQAQELNTAEGITIKATAVGLYRIIDPLKANNISNDFYSAIYAFVQIALRDAVNGQNAESLLDNNRKLGAEILDQVKVKALEFGIEFTELVIRDLILPTDIRNAISEAWRAKKHSLAELEAARGKAAAARALANAAKLYENNPALLQLRYFETIEAAAKNFGNTLVIGMNKEEALLFKK